MPRYVFDVSWQKNDRLLVLVFLQSFCKVQALNYKIVIGYVLLFKELCPFV